MPTSGITNRAEKVIARCLRIASFSEDKEYTRRTFLSPPMRDCHLEVARWLDALQVDARIDAAGNLRALYPPRSKAPRLLIGSHLDTVPRAGAYDGVLGVAIGIALMEELRGRELPFAIEVIGFSEEEGVRFGIPFIGSRALVGRVDRELLKVQDAFGVTIQEAIENFGLLPSDLPEARLKDNTLGYLEFHIEQGPVLERLNMALAAVEAVAGQSRIELTFSGSSNHAGTTPMNLRRDAIAGAAEWIGVVERVAQETSGLVATVGKIVVKPGAANVIASEARLTLDIRHSSDDLRTGALENLLHQAREIAARRDLSMKENILLDQRAVAMDPLLVGIIEAAIAKSGSTTHRMVSGAGHDAMILAPEVPSAMIFLRSPGGISHDPKESVEPADVEKAIECGLHLLDLLASSPEFMKRTRLA